MHIAPRFERHEEMRDEVRRDGAGVTCAYPTPNEQAKSPQTRIILVRNGSVLECIRATATAHRFWLKSAAISSFLFGHLTLSHLNRPRIFLLTCY
ncbi:unnamed protein product [Periconia digitata]|uniref:Uncharacterized protein n=1 Tax=Periconia digitata TaxID=1303443 RepID=A0A9W4U472_9PLEO|nr:unnamed protein product [Periconia digitata]